MTRVWGQVGVLIGLIVLLAGTPSWGGGLPSSNDNSTADGKFNTGGGTDALGSNTTGTSNTAYGFSALGSNEDGNFNTAVGASALSHNFTGTGNFALGRNALLSNTAGNSNVAMGRGALAFSTGSRNIGVGPQSGANLTGGDNNLYVGSLEPSSAGAESDTLRLGSTQTRAFLMGANVGVTGSPVYITADGQVGLLSSSARVKRDIEPVGSRSHALGQLRPVSFRYTNDPAGGPRYGLIAEEVAPVYPELVTHTPTGAVLGLDYPQLIPLLLNELQRDQQELAALKAEQESLRAELVQMRAALAPQTAALAGR